MTALPSRKNFFSGSIFAPKADFYDLLHHQAIKTLEGVEALQQWIASGAHERGQKVRDLEKEADELKLQLQRELVECFITPFDREDIWDLSVRLDEVINSAKAVVREMEALDFCVIDASPLPMAEILVEGTRCILLAFACLKTNPKEAYSQALLARRSENRFVKIYRSSMRQLFTLDDCKMILKTLEVYRYLMQAAEKIDQVGEKLLHVIIKIT